MVTLTSQLVIFKKSSFSSNHSSVQGKSLFDSDFFDLINFSHIQIFISLHFHFYSHLTVYLKTLQLFIVELPQIVNDDN